MHRTPRLHRVAARDIAAGVEQLQRTEGVDPDRVAVWGYCTGGTLAWLAACQCDAAAAILFFPSQPTFAELSPATPVHRDRPVVDAHLPHAVPLRRG